MMSEQALITETTAALSPTARVVSPSANLELLAEQFESSWPGIGPAIALAGAAYPVILALGSLLVIVAMLFNLAFNGSPVQPNELGRVVAFLFVGGTVG